VEATDAVLKGKDKRRRSPCRGKKEGQAVGGQPEKGEEEGLDASEQREGEWWEK